MRPLYKANVYGMHTASVYLHVCGFVGGQGAGLYTKICEANLVCTGPNNT